MYELKTQRLKLLCLEIEDMELSKDSIWKLEDKLELAHSAIEDQGDELATVFYGVYRYHQNLKQESTLLWYRLWKFVSLDDNRLIGGACFKGAPNWNGEVEIGYGIDDRYQNHGYATEAIGELVTWARNQEGVEYVLAETLKDNVASNKVLHKIGMIPHHENAENFYWRL